MSLLFTAMLPETRNTKMFATAVVDNSRWVYAANGTREGSCTCSAPKQWNTKLGNRCMRFAQLQAMKFVISLAKPLSSKRCMLSTLKLLTVRHPKMNYSSQNMQVCLFALENLKKKCGFSEIFMSTSPPQRLLCDSWKIVPDRYLFSAKSTCALRWHSALFCLTSVLSNLPVLLKIIIFRQLLFLLFWLE